MVIRALLTATSNQKFFREERFVEQTIWVEKITNKKGTHIEVALFRDNGGLNKLLIPIGEDQNGLDVFFKLISNYPLAPPLKATFKPQPPPPLTIKTALNLPPKALYESN